MRMRLLLSLGLAPVVVVRPAPLVIGPGRVVVRPAYRGGSRRDMDGDGRPNRQDRDMGGDGASNHHDRWPGDQRRW